MAIRQGIDLIFCDYDLADGTAEELLNRIRVMGLQIPMVVFTENDRRILTDQASISATDILVKPFNMDHLLAVIRQKVSPIQPS